MTRKSTSSRTTHRYESKMRTKGYIRWARWVHPDYAPLLAAYYDKLKAHWEAKDRAAEEAAVTRQV